VDWTPRESKLCEALHDAYTSREDLEIMLAFRLNKSLDDIVQAGTLKGVIFQIVKYAKGGGWLDNLANAVLEDRPDNQSLKAWAKTFRLVDLSDPSPPTQQQLLDSVYFDLRELRKAIRQARAAATSRVLGFGVSYPELVFVNKLCDWLANSLAGETQRKDALNLKPELGPVARRIYQVELYRRDLESANVLCLVYVDTAPPQYIAEFWSKICQEYNAIEHHFVFVFTGDNDTKFPDGIAVLPQPRFDLDDVHLWAEEMISRRRWPLDLAAIWTDLLRAEAFDGEELDVRALYEAMDRSIQQIRFEPDVFRRRLEEGIRHANPA
jgi:Effector-associated domain 1